jgi:DNA-directed RNA polymerase specialized sigma24 family protein
MLGLLLPNLKSLMNNEVTCSIQQQCEKRLEHLYRESNTWLLQVAYNICKNKESSEDLVQECYEYLHLKQNPKLWYKNSYNLIYCMHFIKHRWINKTKKLNRTTYVGEIYNEDVFEEYDYDKDKDIQQAYTDVLDEIERLKKTKGFASAMLYELYWGSEDTLQEVADKIGISKSTVFLSIKKTRNHMKKIIKNPFND